MPLYPIPERRVWGLLRGLQRAFHLPDRGFAANILGAIKELLEVKGHSPWWRVVRSLQLAGSRDQDVSIHLCAKLAATVRSATWSQGMQSNSNRAIG